MKNRIQNLTLFALAAALAPSIVQAKGGNVGNGGLAFVCRENEKIRSAHLVDLIEAERADKRILIDSTLTKEAALTQVLQNLDRHGVEGADVIRSELLDGLKTIRSTIAPVNHIFVGHPGSEKLVYLAVSLPNPQDYDLRATLPGCSLEVVGLYDDASETLHLNHEIYESLSGRDQLAFEIHEVLFKLSRLTYLGLERPQAFESDFMLSNRTRELVGVLFSDPSQKNGDFFTSIPERTYYNSSLIGPNPGKEIEYKYAMLTRHLECTDTEGTGLTRHPLQSPKISGISFAKTIGTDHLTLLSASCRVISSLRDLKF